MALAAERNISLSQFGKGSRTPKTNINQPNKAKASGIVKLKSNFRILAITIFPFFKREVSDLLERLPEKPCSARNTHAVNSLDDQYTLRTAVLKQILWQTIAI